jgi:hypothetical protein
MRFRKANPWLNTPRGDVPHLYPARVVYDTDTAGGNPQHEVQYDAQHDAHISIAITSRLSNSGMS